MSEEYDMSTLAGWRAFGDSTTTNRALVWHVNGAFTVVSAIRYSINLSNKFRAAWIYRICTEEFTVGQVWNFFWLPNIMDRIRILTQAVHTCQRLAWLPALRLTLCLPLIFEYKSYSNDFHEKAWAAWVHCVSQKAIPCLPTPESAPYSPSPQSQGRQDSVYVYCGFLSLTPFHFLLMLYGLCLVFCAITYCCTLPQLSYFRDCSSS